MLPPDIFITQHAWYRFITRWQGAKPECFEKELRRLLASATEEDLGYGATIRTIQNGFTPAAYWRSGDWRFVTNEEKTNLLTCERVYIGPRKTKKFKNPRRYNRW